MKRTKILLRFVGVLAIAVALYNAVAIINFAAKHPGTQGPASNWIGVVIPLIAGIIMLVIPFQKKKIGGNDDRTR